MTRKDFEEQPEAYSVIAVIGVAVYVANDGRSNILGVVDTEYVD